MGRFINRKDLVWSALLLLALAAYYYLPATVNLLQARSIAKDKPELRQIPQPLVIDRSEPVNGEPLSYFGISFSTPWGESKPLRQGDSLVLLGFQRTRSLVLFGYTEQLNLIKNIRDNDKSGATQSAYGASAMKSNFDLRRAVLYTNPADLSFSFDRARMIRNSWFVIFKSADVSRGRSEIHEFRTEKVRGFQLGDPAKSDGIVLLVFDRYDRESTVIVATVKNAPTRLTQAEVNTIILSLDSVPSDPISSLAGK